MQQSFSHNRNTFTLSEGECEEEALVLSRLWAVPALLAIRLSSVIGLPFFRASCCIYKSFARLSVNRALYICIAPAILGHVDPTLSWQADCAPRVPVLVD